MVEIGKKLLFTFCTNLENVPFFAHLNSKFAKSATMTQNINQYGYEKMQNFMLLSNSLISIYKNVSKKVLSKKLCELGRYLFFQVFSRFFAYKSFYEHF